jgi:hypothetical protein
MWDLDYSSQAEEAYELMSDPEFIELMNEPSESEINEMADWYEHQGVAA